jgi:hypothetical protein
LIRLQPLHPSPLIVPASTPRNPLGRTFLLADAIEHILLLSHNGSAMLKKETEIKKKKNKE